MGAGLESAFFSTMGNMATGTLNNIFQQETNSQNRALSREQTQIQVDEAAKNREFQDEQRISQNQWQEDLYNKYSSPLALVSNMRHAGVNPSAALAGGTSVSQPFSGSGGSTGSGSMPSISSIGQAVAPQFPNIVNSVGSFMESVAKVKKAGVETQGLEQMIPKQIESLLLKNQGQELLNAQQQLDYDINKMVKDDKIRSFYYQWRNLMFDTFVKGADADLKRVQAVTEISKQRLNESLSDLYGTEREKLALDISHYEQQFDAYITNLRSQTKANNAAAAKYASEARFNEFTNDMRDNFKDGEYDAYISNLVKEGALSDTDAEKARRDLRVLKTVQGSEFIRKLDEATEWIKSKAKIFN